MGFLRAVFLTVCALLASAPLAPPVLGQEQKKIFVKIAVIDMDSIRQNAAVVKDIDAQIKKYRTAFQAEVKKEEEELRNARQELARQRTILSPDAFAEERRKFEQNLVSVQRSMQRRKLELDKVQAQALLKVRKILNEVVVKVANENEITLIFRKKQTVLVAKPLEITQQVLTLLDEKLPSVKVAKPGQ